MALRRLMKRRSAIAQATPFVVGLVGKANSYALHSGTLLYIVGDRPWQTLRILDLQRSTNQELVVHIPKLIACAGFKPEECRKYKFRILQHASGITTCLYSVTKPTIQNWLLIFDARKHRLIGTIPLHSTIRLFVRNDSKYMIYGTHSEYDAGGIRKWVLCHFDLRTRHLSGEKMPLSDFVGYEIGSVVCFEIFGEYFYGCSNQTSFELEEIDWTSHYYCFRVRLDDFDVKNIRVMSKRVAFRRKHTEGPIDDRWSFLNLETDEATGLVKIVECRREWLNGGSHNMRTYYLKDVSFSTQDSTPIENDTDSHSGNGNDPLPDEPLTRLLRSTDRPNHIVGRERLPHEYHRGHRPGTDMLAKSRVYLSSYVPSAQTFIDLVDDSSPDTSDPQRLRLRAGLDRSHTRNDPQEREAPTDEGAIHAGDSNHISFWPPNLATVKSRGQIDMLEEINQVMNPAELRGSVTATTDSRSIVYSISTGQAGATKVLVFMTFDPLVRLSGMTCAGCLHAESRDENEDIGSTERISTTKETETGVHDAANQRRCCMYSTPSTPPLSVPYSVDQNLQPGVVPPLEDGSSWASIEDAMHQNLSAKYDLSFNSGQGLKDKL